MAAGIRRSLPIYSEKDRLRETSDRNISTSRFSTTDKRKTKLLSHNLFLHSNSFLIFVEDRLQLETHEPIAREVGSLSRPIYRRYAG